MRRRLALARALLVPATGDAGPLLVLDEPTTHLDPDTRTAVLDDLLAATAGRSMILITHDMEALDGMDEVIVLVGGRVRLRGTPRELRAIPGWYRSSQQRLRGDRPLSHPSAPSGRVPRSHHM
jgi:ATP-binding cassette subfamily C protein CydC